ncbi:MAG: D-lyxose/D-mannose family sugar isomerase [Candidatus Aminicenantes bacterium]|nr:D-lyxose/D-mannose family sugar isomerase [Candidatus Aminicenantes bacterium]
MKIEDIKKARKKAAGLLKKARIAITPREAENIEVSDFGLGDLENVGLLVVVYENNDRYCAKEIVLLPRQICPEHRHPPAGAAEPGKQETFRCRFGEVYLYVPGEATPNPRARIPKKYRPHFTVRKEIVLQPGDQYTLPPDTLHWFQAGDKGAVLSEFSSTSRDESDVWTDPRLERLPRID